MKAVHLTIVAAVHRAPARNGAVRIRAVNTEIGAWVRPTTFFLGNAQLWVRELAIGSISGRPPGIFGNHDGVAGPIGNANDLRCLITPERANDSRIIRIRYIYITEAINPDKIFN